MRPLSLAGLFASGRLVLGFINVLRLVWRADPRDYKVIAVGSSGRWSPPTGSRLTAAWLLVAVGMGRPGARL